MRQMAWPWAASESARNLPMPVLLPVMTRFMAQSVALVVDPAVLLEPLKRAGKALLDGQLWFPAGGAGFFGVEKDEGIVADPAFVAAGVFEIRFQSQRTADEANRVVD